MNGTAKAAIVLSLGVALSGCQSLHLPSLSFKSRPIVQAQAWVPAAKTDFVAALEEGRFQTKSGNLSAAAALFRIAQGNAQTRADATNGLGVVYAKLGRTDLAERYFRSAMAQQPAETKFAENLLRLQENVIRDNQLAVRARMAASAEIARVPETVTANGARDISVRTTNVAVATRGMVFIKTPDRLEAAPAMTVSSRTKSVAVVEDAKPAESAAPPEASRVAVAVPANKSIYPIRIDLNK